MKKKHKKLLGWILFLLGIFAVLSSIANKFDFQNFKFIIPLIFTSLDFIRIYIGAIFILIGYAGIKTKW